MTVETEAHLRPGHTATESRDTLLCQTLPANPKPLITANALHLSEKVIPIRGGILRFRRDDGYNASFARQWKTFPRNQLDGANGTKLTRDRFLRETGWQLGELRDEIILEAGSGAGRFTAVMAEADASLITFDYSSAVDVNAANNGDFPNVVFVQADIFDMPFRDGAFDRVFCHGVLQHTPDPARGFRALDRVLRPGGRISIDVYLKDGKIRPWKAKYLWRPLTTRLPQERLLTFLEWFIPKWLPIDTLIKRIPIFGRYLGSLIPCFNYFYTDLSHAEKRRWAVMDTFDALAPTYDIPVRRSEVERWFKDAGYTEYEVREGGNGVVGNGVKPGASG
jgi:SAM-dependent methyltransferase